MIAEKDKYYINNDKSLIVKAYRSSNSVTFTGYVVETNDSSYKLGDFSQCFNGDIFTEHVGYSENNNSELFPIY